MSSRQCQVCRKECKARRCTRCRNAFYCSVECQKRDWKAGHSRSCKTSSPPSSTENVDHVLSELLSITQTMPVQKAEENYHRANDEVSRLKQTDNSDTMQKDMTKHTQQNKDTPSAPPSTPKANPQQQQLEPVTKYFSIVLAEEMIHISRFQLTLRRTTSQEMWDLQDLHLSIRQVDRGHSLVLLKHREDIPHVGEAIVFSVEFPHVLDGDQCSFHIEDESRLHLRLTYGYDPAQTRNNFLNSLTDIKTINAIHCRHCQGPLLRSQSIQRTHQLPTGHWDEIADYLICYSGQPIVDFSSCSKSAEPSVALQDSNVLCLHQEDMGMSACILAVAGYGEVEMDNEDRTDLLKDAAATVRGDRSWRDVTGGAAVYCSNCCAPLGFSAIESPTSFRIFKHHLSIKDDGNGSFRRLSSCASFLAREMVRYAEAKAIYTFIVSLDVQSDRPTFESRKCLLLRLVSWDTRMAVNFKKSSRYLDFQECAKVVFEETVDRTSHDASEDITKWVWGGVDLCCPPFNGEGSNSTNPQESSNEAQWDGKASTVRLLLQEDEYDEVLASLRNGSKHIPKTVAETTILLKMGVSASKGGGGLGLTTIALES